MKIAIIGQGYVGLTLAIGAASAGNTVVGYDSNEDLIQDLINGKNVVPGLQTSTIIKLIKNNKYNPSSNPNLLNGNEIIVIAVPTPLNNVGDPDLSYVERASLQIAKSVQNKALIINESTSYPGTLRGFIKPIISSNSQISFEYASSPERIDPGNPDWNIWSTPRVVSGLTIEASDKALKFYSTFCDKVVVVSSPEVAEAAKLLENTFRQVNIALVNEFSVIANKLGFSANEAILAASSKPFGFMPFFPSIGVGGHCIPVDPSYLSYVAREIGLKTKLIDVANNTNQAMVSYVVKNIEERIGRNLKGLKIQIAGISYKPGVSDLRESPALKLIKELSVAGASVSWHDPIVKEYNGSVSSKLNSDIDLGIIITPHEEIDFHEWKHNDVLVFDLSANPKSYGWPKYF